MSSHPLFDVIQTVHRLRAPNGCPWDRAQTHQSLRPFLIEEAYEVLEALDPIHTEKDLKTPEKEQALREELGDLLLQILLHSEMANEVGAFNIEDVARTLNEKLIRRHPHVFGEVQVSGTGEVLQNWEKIKAKEKEDKKQNPSLLSGLPKSLPALQRTARVIEKVTQVGFQWPDVQGPLEKLHEELEELKVEISKPDAKNNNRKAIEHELGDLLFSICNIAHFFNVQPEDALRSTLTRFENRFQHIEKRFQEQGKPLKGSTLEEMDQYWNEAKTLEKEKS